MELTCPYCAYASEGRTAARPAEEGPPPGLMIPLICGGCAGIALVVLSRTAAPLQIRPITAREEADLQTTEIYRHAIAPLQAQIRRRQRYQARAATAQNN